MVAPHPIKEFNEELEPDLRQCLFCDRKPPDTLGANLMTWRNRRLVGWYSNALLNTKTKVIARFYVCRKHFHLDGKAWEWARNGDYSGYW